MLTRVIRFFCNSRNLHTRIESQSKHIHGLVKISKTEQQRIATCSSLPISIDTGSVYTIVI